MRSSIFSFKKTLAFILLLVAIFAPIEIGLRLWYPFERRENELIELGRKIYKASEADIGLFGNSAVRMLDTDFVARLLQENNKDMVVENYGVSGLSGVHVLLTMLELERLPKTCILPISFRDSDLSVDNMAKSQKAIFAGARHFDWDVFTYYVEYQLDTGLSTVVNSLGNFPPQMFIVQSAKEMLHLKPIDAYRSLFGYHFTHAKKENDTHKQYEYWKFVFEACLQRQQPLGNSYLDALLGLCSELEKHCRVIVIRMPIDPQVASLEKELYADCLLRLEAFTKKLNIPYYDFNDEKYPIFETKDAVHLTKSARKRFVRLLVRELFLS